MYVYMYICICIYSNTNQMIHTKLIKIMYEALTWISNI